MGDGTTISWLGVFHLYKGSWRRTTGPGSYVKGSVKKITKLPYRIWGRRYRPIRRGFIFRALVLRSRARHRFADGSIIRFMVNDVFILKRRDAFRSKWVYGPISRQVSQKKLHAYFNTVI